MTTNKLISDLPAASALTGAELLEATQSGGSVQTTTGAVASLAATYSRTLAVASMTAHAGGGTATPGTGTLTLGSGTLTSNYSDTPLLYTARGSSLYGVDAYAQLKLFSPGSGDVSKAQTTFAVGHASAALTGLLLRIYGSGVMDLIADDSAPTTLFNTYLAGTPLANDGQDWFRVRVSGGVGSLLTARGASSPGGWKLWWAGPIIGSGRTTLESDAPNIALRLDAQSGVSGALSAQWGDVTVRDL